MKDEREIILLRIDRKTGILMLGVLAVVLGGFTVAEQLTLSTSYPVPSGIYNQLITTGNSGSVAADTTFNRNAGNTILVPPTNGAGNVGIGTVNPAKKLVVAGDADVSGLVSGGAVTGGVISGGLVSGGDVKVGPNSVFSQFSCTGGVTCTRTGNTLNITYSASACVPTACTAAVPACGQTTWGTDGCGNGCSKTGDACAGTKAGSCALASPPQPTWPALSCIVVMPGGGYGAPQAFPQTCASGWTPTYASGQRVNSCTKL